MLEIAIKMIIFLFPLAYSPGPGNIFFAINGAKFGFKKTIAANTGYHIATWIVTFLIGFGFVKAAAINNNFLSVIKYLGSAYIMYLAYKLFTSETTENNIKAKYIGFYDGIILLVLNPKAYVIIMLLFSQFLEDSNDNQLFTIIFITTVFTVNNLISFSLWAVVGDLMLRKINKTKSLGLKYEKLINMGFGLILFLIGLWIIIL